MNAGNAWSYNSYSLAKVGHRHAFEAAAEHTESHDVRRVGQSHECDLKGCGQLETCLQLAKYDIRESNEEIGEHILVFGILLKGLRHHTPEERFSFRGV